LGLSVSLSIVNACGGTIKVQSEIGKGTTFIVSFPESKQTVGEING
jgi:signal transduction histidine kinase